MENNYYRGETFINLSSLLDSEIMVKSMKFDDVGEEAFLDEDSKILNKIRKKNKKPDIDMLNSADITDRDMDELFVEV